MLDLGSEFARRGHAVALMAPSEFISEKIAHEKIGNLEIIKVRSRPLKGVPRVVRGLREFGLSQSIWKSAKQYLTRNKYDLVVFYSPTVFWGPLVRRLKSLWQCPAYLVLRDIWPQFLVDTGVLSHGLIWRIFKHFQHVQDVAADFIGIQSPSDRPFVSKGGYVEVLNNWGNMELPEPDPGFRAEFGLHGKLLFFYGGNFGIAQDLDNLLRLGISLRSIPEAVVVLVGEGTEKERICDFVIEHDLGNILILPSVSQTKFEAIVRTIDVGLISLAGTFTIQNIPGKLMAYLAAGKPVLASVNAGNDLFEILGSSGAGFCIENGRDAALAVAARELAENADLRRFCGQKALELMKNRFSVESAADVILSHFL
jgi:glycosyltransferase involved in cell wall biosynthesis